MTTARSNRDDQCVEYIADYLRRKQYAPTVREIGKRFGQSSSSTTSQWLQRLRREGRIDWTDGETRTLHVVRQDPSPDVVLTDDVPD